MPEPHGDMDLQWPRASPHTEEQHNATHPDTSSTVLGANAADEHGGRQQQLQAAYATATAATAGAFRKAADNASLSSFLMPVPGVPRQHSDMFQNCQFAWVSCL